VKIAVEKSVAVPPARAMAVYTSPAFYEGRPTRDDIAVLGVVRHEDTGTRALVEVHFAFTGSVSAAVRAVVDPARLSWVTRTVVVPAESRATWEVLPDHYQDRLTAGGTFRFLPGTGAGTGAGTGIGVASDGPAATTLRVDGDLRVHVPIVGRSVERTIVTDLRRYIEDEVASLPAFV
jgi:Protein of unknown function (DUF2505)